MVAGLVGRSHYGRPAARLHIQISDVSVLRVGMLQEPFKACEKMRRLNAELAEPAEKSLGISSRRPRR